MSHAEKLLAATRRNPAGDFRMEDVATVCGIFGADCVAPSRGSHFRVVHPSAPTILTIPARRPIEPVYMQALVAYIDHLQTGTNDV